jgi:hypothetical protein
MARQLAAGDPELACRRPPPSPARHPHQIHTKFSTSTLEFPPPQALALAEAAVAIGLGRIITFAIPLIHFIMYLLTYSVPLFLKRQGDRTLGGARGLHAAHARRQARCAAHCGESRAACGGGRGRGGGAWLPLREYS